MHLKVVVHLYKCVHQTEARLRMEGYFTYQSGSMHFESMWFDRISLVWLCLLVFSIYSATGSFINGSHLKVVAAELVLTFHVNKSTGSFGGLTYELLEWLSRRLNFTFDIVCLDEFDFGVEVNGSYTGLLGFLHRKDADIALSAFGYDDVGRNIGDPSFIWGQVEFSFLIPYPKEESKTWASLKPFQYQLWLWILFSFLVIAVCMSLFKKLGSKFKPSGNKSKSVSVSSELMYLVGVITGQGGYLGHKGRSLITLGTVWCLAALVLISAYSSLLMSFLSTIKLIPVADSLQELSDKVDQIPLYTFLGSWPDVQIMNSESGYLKVLKEYLIDNPDSRKPLEPSCLEEAARNDGFCLTATGSIEIFMAKSLRESGKCQVSRAKEVSFPTLLFLLFQRHSPYTKELNHQIAWASAVGLTDKWVKDQLKAPRKCLERTPSQARKVPLSLKGMSSAFILLVISYLASIICFTAEVVIPLPYKKHKNMF